MRIEARIVEGVLILDLRGKIRIGEETASIRNQIQALSQTGVQRILLNLANVSDIDSSGVGELASAYTSVRKRGGQLKLLHLTGRLRQILSVTKLLTVFDCYEDEKAAVASFFSESQR